MALVDTPDLKTGFWVMAGILLALVAASAVMSLYNRARNV